MDQDFTVRLTGYELGRVLGAAELLLELHGGRADLAIADAFLRLRDIDSRRLLADLTDGASRRDPDLARVGRWFVEVSRSGKTGLRLNGGPAE